MYSAPTLLLTRLALYEKNEKEAIFHLTRLLLLHELVMREEFINLQQSPIVKPFPQLQEFLKESLTFMDEIEEGYYLDTKIKWDLLKLMGHDEIAVNWEKRKIELKNREGLKLE